MEHILGVTQQASRLTQTALAPEPQPLTILHVDIDNSITLSSTYATDVASAVKGNLITISAKKFVSHVLAEAAWGTINAETGEWSPVSGTPLSVHCCLHRFFLTQISAC